MRAAFITHSGFFVELEQVCLLFDWWKGELPPLPEKPLLAFASHRHEDHFNPSIFSLDTDNREVRFLLGKDIKLTPRNLERWGLSQQTADKCLRMSGGDTVEVLPGVTVEALHSTDEGVAFLVSTDEAVIYHAGDLNWWHWEGEDKAWNNNMEANFKRYTQPLKGRRIDLAMLPLDSRLGEAGMWGVEYLLSLADIRKVLPMHQWEDFSFTDAYLKKHPAHAEKMIPVEKNDQLFDL